MRKYIVLSCLLIACVVSHAQTPYWQDVATVQVGREYPRTEFVTYADKKVAACREFAASENYRLLNGTWKFLYFDAYGMVPESVVDPATDSSSWNDIKVPGNWELQGYGVAIYTNHPYEFKTHNPRPPQLPEANPVGVYRREFTIDKQWCGKNIYLNLAGAKSGVYVYINGREVGYSEDSKDNAQFLINDYVEEGENTLVLKIFRWSTGSYLECQDFWRISGIERDVYLTAQEKTSIKDFEVVSTFGEELRDGLFKLNIKTMGDGVCEVGYSLSDAAGNIVLAESRGAKGGDNVQFEGVVANAAKWSAEEPNLYRLMMSIKCGDKVEYVPFNVGFRRFEIKQLNERHWAFLVNGEPVKFKGVNIHEHNEYTGHYISEEDMRHDLELMRRNNINAVRTAHYPQPRRFYELCDEIGIYVYCEANIESHGMGYSLDKGRTLANNPDWKQPHLDRINNMYEIYKNYPCVTIWSLGNEAGNGYNFYLGYDLVAAKEKGDGRMNRPICYERAQWEWNSDMYVPQYPGAKWFESRGIKGADRPLVPSEYSHSMGNSTGGLWFQWQHIYAYPNLQGGFIWDWIDQGFAATDENGVKYWKYGGDYGVNQPSDANFLCNGIIGPDRKEHPAMAEVKWVYSDIAFHKGEAAGEYEIENRFYFKDLSGYKFRYTYLADGKAVRSGELRADVAPQSRTKITIPALKKMAADKSYTLKLEAVTLTDDRLIPAGWIIAHDAFELQKASRTDYAAKASDELSIEEDIYEVKVKGKKVEFVFFKMIGHVTSYKYNGRELFAPNHYKDDNNHGFRPIFWRASTDNDFGNGAPKRCYEWFKATCFHNVVATRVENDANGVTISADYGLPYDAMLTVDYIVNSAGFVTVKCKYRGGKGENLPELPRLGLEFYLPRSMEAFAYYGRGPEENYWDRNNGTLPGLYHTTASAEHYPYVRPQETGHHTDVEWIAFDGLKIVAADRMEFNVLCNGWDEYDPLTNTKRDFQWRRFFEGDTNTQGGRRQMHTNDIDTSKNDYIVVNIDYRQTGVGGYDSWGSLPEPECRLLTDGNYEWSFTMIPQ